MGLVQAPTAGTKRNTLGKLQKQVQRARTILRHCYAVLGPASNQSSERWRRGQDGK